MAIGLWGLDWHQLTPMTGTTFGEGEASTATVSAFMLADSPTPEEPGQAWSGHGNRP